MAALSQVVCAGRQVVWCEVTDKGELRAAAQAWARRNIAGPAKSYPNLHSPWLYQPDFQIPAAPERRKGLLAGKKGVQVRSQRGGVTCLISPNKSDSLVSQPKGLYSF